MGDDWHFWGCDAVSGELLVVVSKNVIVTNSSITNLRLVISCKWVMTVIVGDVMIFRSVACSY